MKYYFNSNIEVTKEEYIELYKRHYIKGVDPAPSRFIKMRYYATSTNWTFRKEV